MGEPRPLDGLRVVEAAAVIMAPSAAAIMADFGAEVIKVEPPEGDDNRRLHELPALPDSAIPYGFLVDNRSKQSITLDLKHPDALGVLHRLVARADVFVTNYRPAARERLRVRWEDLEPLNPRLVYASASGFGEVGPEANRPAYDTVAYWARSGLESTLLPFEGTLGTVPAGSGDHPSGLALFGAVMLALFNRQRTGRGGKVSTSLLASGAWSNATLLQAQLCGATFHPKQPRPRARSFGSVHYRTRDERLLKLSILSVARLWPAFCRALERPDLIDDPRFATAEARREHTPELIRICDEVVGGHDAAHWRGRLEAHDIAFAILPTYAEITDDPQMIANGMFPAYDHPRFGPLRTVDSPIAIAGVSKVPPRPAPEPGEHTVEVLQMLGYGKEEIERLLEGRAAFQAAP